MAADLAREPAYDVTIADVREEALALAATRCGGRVRAVRADLSDQAALRKLIAPFDIVLGALSSRIGFAALRTVIGAGKNYADISFMAEDAIDLSPPAEKAGVTTVVDCGVAPGMSNLLAGYAAATLAPCEAIEIYVGGLPVERRWPFEYKAAFSPADVIEEYVRPSRIVENGRVVVRPALSEPELLDLPGVGTVEAFNTDGLRSIVRTLNVPNMKEKTLRYPGHIELMRVFREIGLFGTEAISAGGHHVVPRDVIAALMFPKWTYEPGERDLTVMRVTAVGVQRGGRVRLTWDLLDYLDPATGFTSMARTTGFPCTSAARMIVDGTISKRGVLPPELFATKAVVDRMMTEMQERGVRYEFRQEAA